MFILLDKLYLIFDHDDLFPNNGNDVHGNHKYFIVLDLKSDSNEYTTTVQWPVITKLNRQNEQNESNNNEKAISFNCGAFSSTNDFLALTDNHKNLVIFDRYFKPISQVQIKKNAIKLMFNKNEDKIFIGDKSGDIYEYAFKCNNPNMKLLLGHCSMLLDFTVTADEKFIISADRDEKIRITHYPNTYSIANYCLGHTEFVSVIQLINEKTLISGSGDGRLKIWDYTNGKILYTYDCESSSTEERSASTSFPLKIDDNGETRKITKIQSKFAIKSINLDQKNGGHQHLCVSFYLNIFVYLFKIIFENDGSFRSLELLTSLRLANIPTLVCFDKSHVNFLWIFQLNQKRNSRMVELYEFQPNTNQMTKALVSTNIIDALNQNEHLKQTASKMNDEDFSILATLYKPSYENQDFQDNQDKKKSRIESDLSSEKKLKPTK